MHKNLESMNKILALLLFIPVFALAQTKDCVYDIDEKTDSTSLKVLPQKLMHEKIFGSSSDYLFFSLVNENDVPILNMQLLQKSNDFIPTNCLSKSSKVFIQLDNGKIITLVNAFEGICSDLNYDASTKNNIRILNAFYYFTKTNYEELKNSPIALMRIQFSGETKDFVLKAELESETLKTKSNPARYFMEYLKCVE